MFTMLHIAQSRRIRRRNVDGDIAGQRIHLFHADKVIIYRLSFRGIFVLTYIDAENSLIPRVFHIRYKRINTLVIKPHAVNDGVMLRQAKHAWLRVTRLRAWGDGSYFYETKSHLRKSVNTSGVFIETGRKPHR